MKIVICSSLRFTKEFLEISEKLESLGHEVKNPYTIQEETYGKHTVDNALDEHNHSEPAENKIKYDVIKLYHNEILKADAILITNYDSRGIPNYIGGNTFLEMGFAHILDKKTFILNDIPDMLYTDEIKAFQPIILNQDLTKIK